MALTISIEGRGVIANCDAISDSAGGAWSEVGGGTISLTTDVFLYGTACIAGAYSNKSGFQQYDLSGTVLNFTTGAETGQHIYMWIHCPTIGLLETKANKGLAIRICGPTSTDYREFLIAGSNDANGWEGGWRCFVIDPTKPGSIADTGSYEASQITYLGVWIETAALAKGDNIFIDQIAVGKGLRVSGTSTTGWSDVADYCTDYPNRAWGMFQEREGIYYQYGKVWVGSPVQTANVSFQDTGRVIQHGISEYYATPTWVTLASKLYAGLVVEDAASYSTTFIDGVKVGGDAGRSGSVFIGNANHSVNLILDANATSGTLIKLYGSRFSNMTGSIILANQASNEVYSVQFEGCEQVYPATVTLRNVYFINTAADDAALLWTDFINISKCYFLANTNGAGTEHVEATSVTYGNLTFSGNTYDVLNNTTGSLFISAVDSEVSNATNPLGGDTKITQDVFLTVNVENADGDAVASARVRITTSLGTELMNEKASAGGQAQTSFNYYGVTDIDIYVRRSTPALGQRYVPLKTSGQIGSGGFTLTAVLQADNIA